MIRTIVRNKVNVAIRQAKELFYKKKFSNLTATRVKRGRWSMSLLLAERAGPRLGSWVWINISITNSTTLSNAFNDHFSTLAPNWHAKYLSIMALVFRNISLALMKDFSSSPLIAIRFFLFFIKLNKCKGAGLDGILSRRILDCADLITLHISIIFNSSLANGIFPDDWKSARVTPPFKHGKEAI